MAARTPEERTGAFLSALIDEPEILITEDVEESTAVTPPLVLAELAEVTRTGVTPPPAPLPLGGEARDHADRVRFVLLWHVGMSQDAADDVLARAHDLMPRVRR
jgi:hypothetical protein